MTKENFKKINIQIKKSDSKKKISKGCFADFFWKNIKKILQIKKSRNLKN